MFNTENILSAPKQSIKQTTVIKITGICIRNPLSLALLEISVRGLPRKTMPKAFVKVPIAKAEIKPKQIITSNKVMQIENSMPIPFNAP
ncbi:MAG: hypothetical protein ACD_79C01175G0001 [uncultured bacterium]|nr:MAG: hypothetical protein ACD_79C01175G0001 [uncultured bacterium]